MLKIKLRALLANAWSPHVIIPLNFQMSVHLERGYPLRPFICLGFEDPLDKVSKVGHFSLFEREPAASVVRANLVSRVILIFRINQATQLLFSTKFSY